MPTQLQSHYIPYSQTGKFSKIVLDYIDQAASLKEFYEHPVNIEGIKSAISQRKNYNTNRRLLVDQLNLQYKNKENSEAVRTSINALLDENTFTICTAHQPNIFTGHLYFIYKIMHAIKLSHSLKKQLPEYNFVPVFFVGSEDADLEELNHIVIDGKKFDWQTKQTGAVGRMKVDDNLLKLIEQISGRLSVEKYGIEITDLLKRCYKKNITIEEATFLFVHELFKEYGLIVLLPDNAEYKRTMLSVFKEDILNNIPSKIVQQTSEKLAKEYKAQAYPREINLFYLKGDIRNRIVASGNQFTVHDSNIIFSREEMEKELDNHPERFSPNVILRGLFQEIILPDVAWIGGGGELAYWLQLKDLFDNYKVPFPVLIVRNSFLLIEKKYAELLEKLDIKAADLFKGNTILLNDIINRESTSALNLDIEKERFHQIYEKIKTLVKQIDITLVQHASALETKQLKTLNLLEKKMLRAEKRKFSTEKNKLAKIFGALFPENGLQERTENFMLFYSKWGNDFFKNIYENSLTLEEEFCVLEEVNAATTILRGKKK
jgi:bacillithiol biosynthesis cysteine-adding enzyme BshC